MSTTFSSVSGCLIRTATAPAFRRFQRSLDQPAEAQQRLLKKLLRDSARSAYGRQFEIRKDDELSSFQEKIPIVGYQDLRPWIERAVFKHEPNILSPHKIVRVEATSGSSAATKWIPYTRPMMRTFSRMFTLWAHDLLATGSYRPKSGRLYLCVTGGRPDDGKLANELVGDDRDYLGKRWRTVLDRFVIAPQFASADNPLERLALALDNEPQLEVMSFWSPSLLLAVLDHMGIHSDSETRRRWPELQLISCWTAASSAHFADRLRSLFPDVRLQGKGLLSTEAALTIPLELDGSSDGGCIPLLDDVLLEFIDPTKDSQPLRLDQLRDGGEYEVLLSNRSGMLRYRIGDRVRVLGQFRQTPRLEFIGRAGVVSDLVGEKLSLEFVEQQLGDKLGSTYYCLLPTDRGYQLWIDSITDIEPVSAEAYDRALCKSFHYQRARRLEQLLPLEVFSLAQLDEHIRQATEDQNQHRGRAFKPQLMISDRTTAAQVSDKLLRKLRANRA